MPKVLIVDDSLTDRVRVSGIASKWSDCSVLEAENGRVALDVIELHRPDLIVTDLQMPDMNGLELVAAVKEDHPHIPVILMTGVGSEEIAAQALRTGAASYVPKSRLAVELLDTLDQVYATARVAHSQFRLMHYMTSGVNTYVLPNDLTLIRGFVAHVLNMLRCLPLGDESERLRVGIALQAALMNACIHGNLDLPGDDRSDANQLSEEASRRVRQEPWGLRKINVTADISRERAVFVIRDEGNGFDFRALDQEDETRITESDRGRGITLMKSIMDEVEYGEPGNEVRMTRNAVRYEEDDDFEDD